jgi:lipopolysaccharide transport system ATP-binding protein
MSEVVIRAEGLGKQYFIGHESPQERYTALRDVIGRTVKGFARFAGDMMRGRQLIDGDDIEEFWALKDVNFEIKRGEVVGIIGRNGAGKSTLLKILSRITEPSAGRVEIRGRIASLLEVGTGFHPELTGRENIFLNGAILGMSRTEITRKFDEIVAFAEVEKFLDTPVKRYSSGMYVRLAFAVAAHLEPEILVVDEVLAVGDAEFQKKCLGRMQDVAGHGRTVLFVSHNMAAVRQLCSNAILMMNGHASRKQSTDDAVDSYLATRTTRNNNIMWNDYVNPYFTPQNFYADHSNIYIEGLLIRNDPRLHISLGIFSLDGTLLFWSNHTDSEPLVLSDFIGSPIRLAMPLPTHTLNEGVYEARLVVHLHNMEYLIHPNKAPTTKFQIELGTNRPNHFLLPRAGILAPVLQWSLEKGDALA